MCIVYKQKHYIRTYSLITMRLLNLLCLTLIVTSKASDPTPLPTLLPTLQPIASPTTVPIASPTTVPIASPTTAPVSSPTTAPSTSPTIMPSPSPSSVSVSIPSPTAQPTKRRSTVKSLNQLSITLLGILSAVVAFFAMLYLHYHNKYIKLYDYYEAHNPRNHDSLVGDKKEDKNIGEFL